MIDMLKVFKEMFDDEDFAENFYRASVGEMIEYEFFDSNIDLSTIYFTVVSKDLFDEGIDYFHFVQRVVVEADGTFYEFKIVYNEDGDRYKDLYKFVDDSLRKVQRKTRIVEEVFYE